MIQQQNRVNPLDNNLLMIIAKTVTDSCMDKIISIAKQKKEMYSAQLGNPMSYTDYCLIMGKTQAFEELEKLLTPSK
jgi:hypothetical protein